MDRQGRVYSDRHVEVLREGDEALGPREIGAAFYRIRAGELELTYDVAVQAWYVRLPGRDRAVGSVTTDTYYASDQEVTMINIDWDKAGSRVLGIEIIGGSSRGKMVVIDVPEPEEGAARGRGSHLQVVPPVGADGKRSPQSLISLADTLAARWHGDIEHPRSVARIVASDRGQVLAQQWNVDLETAQVVALLHHVLEETRATPAELAEAGLPANIIEVVQLLTKPEGEEYMEYIRRVKKNPTARLVKWADLQHNQDRRRPPVITAEDEERFARYARAERLLIDDE